MKIDSQNLGKISWNRFTMLPSIPPGPGLLFSFIRFITAVFVLFFIFVWGFIRKDFCRKGLAVSSSDEVAVPS